MRKKLVLLCCLATTSTQPLIIKPVVKLFSSLFGVGILMHVDNELNPWSDGKRTFEMRKKYVNEQWSKSAETNLPAIAWNGGVLFAMAVARGGQMAVESLVEDREKLDSVEGALEAGKKAAVAGYEEVEKKLTK